MKEFSVKLFHRTTPETGRLDSPENYSLVELFTIETTDWKAAAETAASLSDAKTEDGRRRTRVGDIAVVDGLAYECRMMGWIERRDPDFAGALGLPPQGINGRLKRALGSWKIHWERAKAELRSK